LTGRIRQRELDLGARLAIGKRPFEASGMPISRSAVRLKSVILDVAPTATTPLSIVLKIA
jgi:hypothetical protein